MNRWIPRKYRPSLTAAIVVHVLFIAFVAWASSLEDRAVLGAGDGRTVVQVSIINPAPPASNPGPPPRRDPAPKKEEKKQEEPKKPEPEKKEVKPEPTPEPKPEPKKEIRPEPTPAPKATPQPVKPKPEKKETPKPEPKETPKPVIKPPPDPVKKAEPKPEPKKERQEKALTPAESKKLWPTKPQVVARPNASSSRPPAQRTTSTSPRPSTSANTVTPGASDEVKSGSTSLKGMGLPDYYSREALLKLARFFQVPDAKQQDATAILACRITRDGLISNIRIVKSSGNGELNQMAITALQRTERFNPFPDDFSKESVEVEISFAFKR